MGILRDLKLFGLAHIPHVDGFAIFALLDRNYLEHDKLLLLNPSQNSFDVHSFVFELHLIIFQVPCFSTSLGCLKASKLLTKVLLSFLFLLSYLVWDQNL